MFSRGAEYALSMAEDLTQQWFTYGLQVDQVDWPAGCSRKVGHQLHLLDSTQAVIRFHGDIQITVGTGLTRRNGAEHPSLTNTWLLIQNLAQVIWRDVHVHI